MFDVIFFLPISPLKLIALSIESFYKNNLGFKNQKNKNKRITAYNSLVLGFWKKIILIMEFLCRKLRLIKFGLLFIKAIYFLHFPIFHL